MEEEERTRAAAQLRELLELGFIDELEYQRRQRGLRGSADRPVDAQAPPATNPLIVSGAEEDLAGRRTIKCKKHLWTVEREGVAHGANGVISQVMVAEAPGGRSANKPPSQTARQQAYVKEVRDANDEDQVSYLHKELTILTHKAVLANPNIVHLHDWRTQVRVKTTDGVHDQERVTVPPCLVMEICDRSVKDLMRDRHYPRFLHKEVAYAAEDEAPQTTTRLFGEEEAIKLGLEVLNALADLHGVLRIYHGDISAKNVMRSRHGSTARYVLIDFGSSSSFHAHITTPVSQVYAAPEKLNGEWERCDGRCDVFALAVLLSELLVGRPCRDAADLEWSAAPPPHHAETPERQRLRSWEDLLLSELVDWKAFFEGTLVADPLRRWDAAQAAAALRRRPSQRVKRERARAHKQQQQKKQLEDEQQTRVLPDPYYSFSSV